MTYQEQLLDIRWLVRRNEILERDDFCCQDCLRGRDRLSPYIKLQVHHRSYVDGLMAWEYADNYLVTLCDQCHKRVHGLVDDPRSEREKPVFIYGLRDFESRPVRHIREVFIEFIYSIHDGQ